MNSEEIDWSHVVVLGAAGKMGRGIALLLLQEISKRENTLLTLLDSNPSAFFGLRVYLRDQLIKFAEKQINQLRKDYASKIDLIDNGEIIANFVTTAMDRVRCVTASEDCRNASLVFEAIIENLEIKAKVLQEIDRISDHQALFFSNTSSIPIHELERASGIKGRMIGFHFYNPPAIQKLVELVIPPTTSTKLKEQAKHLGTLLKKELVESGDTAGFIGNGHFIREIAEANRLVKELSKSMSVIEAIQLVNRVTQEYLIRPMGIFQLIDYVGIDVCNHIANTMKKYLPNEDFSAPLVEQMVTLGILGGQNSDGSQKEGFFKYSHGKPVEVYNPEKRTYYPCLESTSKEMPAGHVSWKELSKYRERKDKLIAYFTALLSTEGTEAQLAKGFLNHSRAIAQKLVRDGIAKNVSDVDKVLENGFYHLYGVELPFMQSIATGASQ